jgi:SAM-dependent methyltransferase
VSEPNRWSARGGVSGEQYAARFAARAAAGQDVHGEATFCAALVPAPARVLDAGCGTGRVAVRLAELGYDCVGVDSDESMLAVARAASTQVDWRLLDLSAISGLDRTVDLVVAAGNVIPLLAPNTESRVVAGLAATLRSGGRLVAGFGLDAAHLPLPTAPFGLKEYDEWCAAAGLDLVERYATWDGAAYQPDVGYAVSVHHRR